MKFLVNKFYLIILFLFFKILFPASDCIDIWYQSNIAKVQNDLLVINATIYPPLKKKNIDRLKIYIDQINSKIKIESSEQIILFDKQKSVKLFKKEKQLYIDNPDSSIFIFLSSIFNLENIEPVRKSKLQYKLKVDSNFNKTKLFFSEDCLSLESIRMIIDKINFIIDNISFEIYNDIDSLYIFDIQGDYFEYDLRK